MRTTSFLTREEELFLQELDRYVDGYRAMTGFDSPRLVISHRQANTLRRVLDKAKDKPGYNFSKKFDTHAQPNTYRSIPIFELEKPRRYRRRKDTAELPI